MIDALTFAKLVHAAYDPVFVASGALPDLSAFGCHDVWPIYGAESGSVYPYGFLATMPDGSQVLPLRGTLVVGTQNPPEPDAFSLHELVIHWLGHIIGTEWLSNAQLSLVPNPWGPGRVHAGFLGVTQTLGIGEARADILSKITSLASLMIGGHSRGAAAARLLSMRLGHVGALNTYGEPRSCDSTAAQYAASCCSANRRSRNPRDIVPMVPVLDPSSIFDFYQHAGDPFKFAPFGDDPVEAHSMANYVQAEAQLTTTSNP